MICMERTFVMLTYEANPSSLQRTVGNNSFEITYERRCAAGYSHGEQVF